MSYQTKRSGSQWMSIQAPVDYAGVVANYAASFIQAQIEQVNRELENKILDYKNGTLSYQALVDFIQGRLGLEAPGTAMELNLRKALFGIQDYERQKNMEIKRATLEAKYSKDGISAKERYDIEKELLQYFKEGTPEYSEQLATIAKADDYKRQEENNIKLAKIQAELSKGGLTTGEQIKYLEEAAKLTDKGSKDYQELQGQINLLKDQKKTEDLEAAKTQRLSQLLDQYAGGGLSDQELLNINHEMQSFTQPGTAEYVELKQAEARILGDIANGGGSGSGGTKLSTLTKNQAEAELARLDVEKQALEQRFQIGAISDQEYLQSRSALYGNEAKVLENLGNLVGSDESLSKYQGKLQAEMKLIDEQTKAYQEGKAVTIKKDGLQGIVSLEEAALNAEEKNVYDMEGNLVAGNVITTNTGGVEKQFLVKDGGKFELLKPDEAGNLKQTGFEVTSIKTERGTPSADLPFTGPTQFKTGLGDVIENVGGSLKKSASDLVAGATGAVKNISSALSGGPKMPTPVASKGKTSNSVSNILKSLTSGARTAANLTVPGRAVSSLVKSAPGIKKAVSSGVSKARSFGSSLFQKGKAAIQKIGSFFGF